MNDLASVFASSSVATIAVMVGLWLLSLRLRNASIIDIYWGPGFAVIAWVACAVANSEGPRTLIVPILATLWGLRLGGYLFVRNRGKPEDYRYAAMRRHHGASFVWVSLLTVFGLQAVLMLIVSLPLQAVQAATPQPSLGLLDAAGITLFIVGLTFESIGDYQLACFKADPANAGKVMNRGLWSWTRHPNYFGDFTLWWGFGCFGLAVGAWWALVGQLIMSVLRMRVSGAALLERGLHKTKPGYAEYVARTSAFFPRPPT